MKNTKRLHPEDRYQRLQIVVPPNVARWLRESEEGVSRTVASLCVAAMIESRDYAPPPPKPPRTLPRHVYPNGKRFAARYGGRYLGTWNTPEEATAAIAEYLDPPRVSTLGERLN